MKIKFISLLFICFLIFSSKGVLAEETTVVDYGDQPVVDSDLDGLTDKAETEVYATDPAVMDSDADGFSDGVEVLSNTDPADATVLPESQTSENTVPTENQQTPWVWYTIRVSGLLGVLLLYISAFLGLATRIPGIRKVSSYFGGIGAHAWISAQALIFALVHGFGLLFDTYMRSQGVRLSSILVPFASPYQKNLITLGVLGMYIMLILVATSYLRRFIPHAFWRIAHYFNLVLFVFVFFHALLLGTDMKNPIVSGIFIAMNALLGILITFNIIMKIAHRNGGSHTTSPSHETLHQTGSSSIPE